MQKTIQTAIRLDPQTKQDFFDTCERLGLSAAAVMTLFAKEFIREQKIPFIVQADTSLDEYVKRNHEHIKQGIDDLNAGRSKIYKANDLDGLKNAINNRREK